MPLPDPIVHAALPAAVERELRERASVSLGGGVVIVLTDGSGRRTVWTHGDDPVGSARPVTEDTWFSIGSVGKQFTAAAVLSLADEGRLDVRRSIGHYLPELSPSWGRRSIDALMRHTSGLPEYFEHVRDDDVPSDRASFVARFGAIPPVFDEGRTWMYSNTNYILLGFLIAETAGMSYARALKQRLFDRIGAGGLLVGGPACATARNAVRNADMPEKPDAEVVGDGDIVANAAGAACWLEALLTGSLLSRAARSASWTGSTLLDGTVAPYGCGWFVDQVAGHPLHHHGGHFDGWSAVCVVAPDAPAGVMLMSNVAPGNTRMQRDLAIRALEAWAPGSTPLGLRVGVDTDDAATSMTRTQLLRESGPPDPRCLSESLEDAAGASGRRSLINLWSGVEPARFAFIDERAEGTGTLRRYRIDYPTRTEHVNVGYDASGRIYWAWPI